ncbi:2,3-dimethylmalate lyase [Aquisphaera giovannonii]|uniref:2,3-dimethylmalate lyase n=1 Tax=Aquisphaera giovannonii TaxID=406548 RepID=A0A5B9VVC2_9BACT|nr:isocitrate lyase/PEP mutase family protein [Aquisphaera giovannonii]QEH31877.1 2,3-dimethylmalate lyase [Aquisphaera giovannonii]
MSTEELPSLSPATRAAWRTLLLEPGPLILPAAHDALAARLIARAGFRAYQVGGFALAGARYGYPDIDLVHFYEENEAIRQIVAASPLPVVVDAGNGFGDVKNVTRTVRGYEELGVSAIFVEDQKSPITCGQMGKREVVSVREMVGKVKAALAARRDTDTFILARTDGRSAKGLDEAIRRGKAYRDAGADGLYIEGLRGPSELGRVGKALAGTPLATTMMEGGGQMDWLSPAEIHELGFAMIMYPTTLLFQITKAMERALDRLKSGRPMPPRDGVTLDAFEDIVGLPGWRAIEERFG